jgi:hypothetical protein
MCTITTIGDHSSDKWRGRTWYTPTIEQASPQPVISREEFDRLKAEVVELKELLRSGWRG